MYISKSLFKLFNFSKYSTCSPEKYYDYRNSWNQFVIFKPLNYFFEKTIGFDVKASFSGRPRSRLIRWYDKPGDLTKEFWEKAIQFHGTFHGLKITNWNLIKITIFVIFSIHPIKFFLSRVPDWPFPARIDTTKRHTKHWTRSVGGGEKI